MCKKVNLKLNIPEATTKQLRLQSCSAGRKLVVSTNFLPLFGFESDSKVVEELIGHHKGIKIRLATPSDTKVKKVYTRTYATRKNNALETQLDMRSQKLLNDAFAQDIKSVHILFRHGEILITPITDKKAQALKKFKNSKTPLSTFLAASSGVDGYSLSKQGFSISTLLEFRPQEKRDKQNFTESGCVNALANFPINTVINEDIMNIDIEKIAELTENCNHTFFHFSPQCNDFSNVKANSLKESSLTNNSSTLDMVIDGINLIQKFNFPVLLIENVKGFATSDIGKMLVARLRRLGYSIHDEVCDGREFGGLTSRVRYYLVATLLPAPFKVPQKAKKQSTPLWDSVQELIDNGQFRKPKSTKSLDDGLKCGRARVITPDSTSIPTILKSQNRMAKDSVYAIDKEGAVWFPKIEALKSFMQIDTEFNLDAVGETLASEIIGQSVEVPMHEAWTQSVAEHIIASHNMMNGKLF